MERHRLIVNTPAARYGGGDRGSRGAAVNAQRVFAAADARSRDAWAAALNAAALATAASAAADNADPTSAGAAERHRRRSTLNEVMLGLELGLEETMAGDVKAAEALLVGDVDPLTAMLAKTNGTINERGSA